MIKLFTPVFSLTLLLSAFLLFSIQPLFSKMVLPYLGGSPMVWNTAMVFFQGMLLAGYGYAYFCSKIPKISLQVAIHAVLFFVFLVFLPFSIKESDIPETFNSPTLWQIGLMLSTIGAPFFILSGCAPLLQRWFSFSTHKDSDNPYFLYAASNLGSMAALLSYPFIIEPLFDLYQQSQIWSGLYLVLACMITLSGILMLRNLKASPFKGDEKSAEYDRTTPTWGKRGLWLLLAFVPSSLMLGVTTYITTDLASLPLLWVLPLAIYVGTFIIAFAKNKPFSTNTASIFQVCTLIVLIICPVALSVSFYLVLHLVAFSITTLAIHMRLADHKPTPEHLTEFYFIMSLGGVLGGIFNALLSPVLFSVPWEYSLVFIISAFLINPQKLYKEIKDKNILSKKTAIFAIPGFLAIAFCLLFQKLMPIENSVSIVTFGIISIYLIFFFDKRVVFASTIMMILLIKPFHVYDKNAELLYESRNFFGNKSVIELEHTIAMKSGTTLHGSQFKQEDMKTTATTYYNVDTATGQAFTLIDERIDAPHVAAIGLGAGTIACTVRDNKNFDYYEIDPSIVDLSLKYGYFTFLTECTEDPHIILGDGRLKIKEAEDSYYDIIFIDAFSSDSIPIHLVTEEAIKLYLQKLKDDGTIIVHISNRHIDLLPVLSTIAQSLNMSYLYSQSKATEAEIKSLIRLPTKTFVMSKDEASISGLKDIGWQEPTETGPQFHWTDSYANILNTLVLIREIQDGLKKAQSHNTEAQDDASENEGTADAEN